MTVPFLDLSSGYKELKSQLDVKITDVLKSGIYIGGKYVEEFEDEYKNYTNSNYCVGVGNGFDALYLSLISLNIKEGDEVIVPANTFIATWLAVSKCGAVPIPVDISRDTCNIDTTKIESVINSRTKAIIPVHLYGNPCNMNEIHKISSHHKLKVIEDAAQAHGASYNYSSIGKDSDLTAWSFYPGKNLGCFGDGGAITTNNEELAKRIRALRNYGSSKKYIHEAIGINSRLDPLQAGILSVKLNYLDVWNQRRQKVAARYINELSSLPLEFPSTLPNSSSSWHLFTIQIQERENLRDYLGERGIQTLIHYPIPPHKQKAYYAMGKDSYPNAEWLSEHTLSLPIGPHIQEEQVDEVVKAIKSFYS